MPRVRKFRRLADAYTFPGFCPLARIVGMFGDARARLITLVRRGKNDLRELRHGSPRLIRPPAPARTGSVLRRPAHLPGPRGPARGPIWFGGRDRSEASLDQFYVFLGKKKAQGIRVAVMDMWKPSATPPCVMPRRRRSCSTSSMIRQLGEALDKVRKHQYARLGTKRRFIKGQLDLRRSDHLTPGAGFGAQ